MEVNKKQLADIFGASIRTIQNWQEQGMPVLRGGGKGILAGCRRNGHGYPVSYPAGVPRSFTFLNPWRTGRPAVQMCFTA